MSGRRNQLYQFKFLNGQSLAASFNSSPTNIEFLDNVGYQLNVTTANAVGTFSFQVSLDYNQDSQGNVQNAGNWVDLPLSTTPTLASADVTVMFDGNQIQAPWIRVAYTRTSGTGTVTGYVSGKMI